MKGIRKKGRKGDDKVEVKVRRREIQVGGEVELRRKEVLNAIAEKQFHLPDPQFLFFSELQTFLLRVSHVERVHVRLSRACCGLSWLMRAQRKCARRWYAGRGCDQPVVNMHEVGMHSFCLHDISLRYVGF